MSTESSRTDDLATRQADVVRREAAAQERRHWVRLTRYCNNRCAFCLDTTSHDGGTVSRVDVNARIIDGRRAGATRLILSGGEPTVHPGFVGFVDLGRRLGYRRVQTITNGRLFAYERFLKRAVGAGLGEITFSIHGHDAPTHDHLVGVPGAFDEAIRGLRNALSDGRVIVNVDVCLNRVNIGGLPVLLDRLLEMGVREFDLLHIIPFGRAYDEGEGALFYEIEEAMPSIEYALEVAARDDVHIWFNRFPPPYLEGHEHLIQDPYKLEDEVRGRKDEYDLLLSRGTPLSCRQPERCRRCYLMALCDTLDETREAVDRDELEVYRVEIDPEARAPVPPAPATFSASWLRASDVETAAAVIPKLPGQEVILDLGRYDGLSDRLDEGRLGGMRVTRAYVSRPEDVDRLLAVDPGVEVVVYLTKANARHLLEHLPRPPANLALAAVRHGRLSDALERDADLPAFFEAYDRGVPVEGVPFCISGRHPRPLPPLLDAGMLDEAGALDAFGFTRRFILDHFMTHSRRCAECAHREGCEGAHINWVRARGYRTLEPVPRPDQG